MFLHCAFWVVHDVWLGVRKNVKMTVFFFHFDVFSDAEKNGIFSMMFFRVRQYGAFWLKLFIAETDTISLRQQAWT